jgi:type IV pilus biogenesis protein PilP
MKKMACLSAVIFLFFIIGGCEKGQPPPKKPTAEAVKPAQTREAPKAEEVKKTELEEYKYNAGSRRDPFLSLIEITKAKPTKKKGATPFESYSLDEIKLLAIASSNNKHYALIKLPDGKTYTLTRGMTVGMQGGKVQRISTDSVWIREYIKDYKGELKPRDTILKLHKGEGE